MKKLDKILDNVMRFLMAVAMFALLAGGTWQIFTRWILRNPFHCDGRVSALRPDLGIHDRFCLLLLQG